nr:MAG TPA: hypothetical protein [Caudoviricetes sp.]
MKGCASLITACGIVSCFMPQRYVLLLIVQ